MSKSAQTDNWSNESQLDYRSKLGLRILLLIFKVVSPYRFGNEFSKEIEAIQKQIDEAGDGK